MGIDSLYKERAISCGVDHTCRIWKIVEESQLLYRGHTASIDCISMINEESFLTGSQDGCVFSSFPTARDSFACRSVALWNAGHKKPNFVFARAHGKENPWVSSICALPFTDLAVSGSQDGHLNFWQFSKTKQALSRVHQLPIVSPMAFIRSSSSHFLSRRASSMALPLPRLVTSLLLLWVKSIDWAAGGGQQRLATASRSSLYRSRNKEPPSVPCGSVGLLGGPNGTTTMRV